MADKDMSRSQGNNLVVGVSPQKHSGLTYGVNHKG